MRKAITRRQHDLYFVGFDLLHLNGHDLRDLPLEDRREILVGMIPTGGRIQFSQALQGDAKSIFHLIDLAGLEGMVSKRRDSKYRSGPSTNWLKAKCYAVGEFELLGVEREAGKPAFALMAERGTGKYVGLCLHHLEPGDAGTPMEARPGARRASAQGHAKAAGDAMGQAGPDRPREGPARRGRLAAPFAAGFLGCGLESAPRVLARLYYASLRLRHHNNGAAMTSIASRWQMARSRNKQGLQSAAR